MRAARRPTRLGYPAPVRLTGPASRISSLVFPTPSQMPLEPGDAGDRSEIRPTDDGTPTQVDSSVAVLDPTGRPAGGTLMQPGAVLAGKYRLVAPIASGGMGHVWLAMHMRLGNRVALKVLHRDRCDDVQVRERFRREALTVAQLRHPSIVQPMDFGTLDDGRDYLVMEYVEGLSLNHLLDSRGPLPWRTVLDVALDVSEALAFAHGHGVVHRDLKPANLIMEGGMRAEGRVRVLDLGIAHNASFGAARTLTQRGTVLGTPAYASPEQLRGEPVGAASDLYSLGVILYRMITGKLPYAGHTFAEVAEAQFAGPPRDPFEQRPDRTRPRPFDDLVLRLLRYRVDERPASAADLHQALSALVRADDETGRHALRRPRARLAASATRGPVSLRAVFLTAVAGTVVGLGIAGALALAVARLLGG